MFTIGLSLFTLASLACGLAPGAGLLVGARVAQGAAAALHKSRAAGGARLDMVGALLVTTGLVLIVLPLVEGRQEGWPLWTWLSLGAAPFVLAVFAAHQRRVGGRALIDLDLFRHRAFTVGAVIAIVGQMAVASFFLILALYLQEGRGLSPLKSGLIFLALGAGYFISSARAAQVAARLGRQALAAGALTLALGYGLLAAVAGATGTGGGTGWLIPGLLVAGCGMGLVMAPLPATALAGITARHAASASGVLSTSLQSGGAIGIAVVGVVYYDVLGAGHFTNAFVVGLAVVIGFCVASAGIVQLLPRR